MHLNIKNNINTRKRKIEKEDEIRVKIENEKSD